MDESMKEWIGNNLNSGYTPQQLRKSLIEHNMDPHLIDEYISYHSEPQVVQKTKTKDTSNVFAFVFGLASMILLFVTSFIPWYEYGTAKDMHSIVGTQTPFGLALIVISGSSLILIISSKFLNRRIAIGSIALSIFAVGIVLIAMFTQKGSLDITTGFNTVAKISIQMSYGIYLAFAASIMSLLGSILCLVKNDHNPRSKLP